MDENNEWRRQALVAVGILVAIGVVVGGIATVISITAAKMTGITDNEPTQAASTRSPTQAPPSEEPTDTGSTAPTETTESTPAQTTERPGNRPAIRLTASPTVTGTYERIDLNGTYSAPDDTYLQVQRDEGGQWVDFPTNARVSSGGTFSTYVETGRNGPNRFRVVDPVTSETSNVVTITIR